MGLLYLALTLEGRGESKSSLEGFFLFGVEWVSFSREGGSFKPEGVYLPERIPRDKRRSHTSQESDFKFLVVVIDLG